MNNSKNNVAAQAGDEPMRAAKAQAQKLRGMAKGPAAIMYGYGALMTAAADTIERLGGQVSPRATADVERNLRAELINAGALRQYCHNDGSAGFVTAYDFDITNRFLAAIATTKPGA